jgi:hypothetical protein
MTMPGPHGQDTDMRLIASLALLACAMLSGCATPSPTFADDRPGIGVQQGTKPFCSSGPNGRTANCAATIGINAAIQAATK